MVIYFKKLARNDINRPIIVNKIPFKSDPKKLEKPLFTFPGCCYKCQTTSFLGMLALRKHYDLMMQWGKTGDQG